MHCISAVGSALATGIHLYPCFFGQGVELSVVQEVEALKQHKSRSVIQQECKKRSGEVKTCSYACSLHPVFSDSRSLLKLEHCTPCQ